MIECDKYSVAVIDEVLIKETDKITTRELLIQKLFNLEHNCNIISKDILTCSKPIFASISELRAGHRS